MTDPTPLSDAERTALDADFALLAAADPAPEPSAALLARIMADAAEAHPQTAAPRQRQKRSLLHMLPDLWRPLSAGLAAATLGIWLGWADPAGVSMIVQDFVVYDLADATPPALEDVALLDMEF